MDSKSTNRIAILLAMLGVVCVAVLWKGTRAAPAPIADVEWSSSNPSAGKISCTVVDLDGNPVQGVKVQFLTPSGWTHGITPKNGHVDVSVDRPIQDCRVGFGEGISIRELPDKNLQWMPLKVKIILKDPSSVSNVYRRAQELEKPEN